MSKGEITVIIASNLDIEGYDVFYDHGDPANENVGKIAVWYGDDEKPERDTELSQLDIAIVKKGTNKAIVLVEVEETSDRPKNPIR